MAANILDTLCMLTAAFSLLPVLPFRHWVYRLPGYLALQLSVLLGVLLGIRLIAGHFGTFSILTIILTGSALIIDLTRIFPYLRVSRKEVPDLGPGNDETLSIISSNVYQENRKYSLLVNLVKEIRPDLFVAVETDEPWGTALESALADAYPYRLTEYRDDTYGMAVFSKHPLAEKERAYIYNETPTFSCMVSHPGLGNVHLFILHPKPPSPTEAASALPKDVEFLKVSEEIGQMEPKERVIVVGDLNDVAWSKATRKFIRGSGLLDPLRGRGIFATFPTWLPVMGFPLDQLFVSGHFQIGELKKLRDIGSDHFPIYYEIGSQPDQ